MANIVNDRAMVDAAKKVTEEILTDDPDLSKPENVALKEFLQSQKGKTIWSKIS
nr:hypothetical protein [Niabella hibiscisoli]